MTTNAIYQKFRAAFTHLLLPKRHSREEAQRHMYELIQSSRPFMAARFGSVEIKAVLYKLLPWPLSLTCRKWAFTYMKYNAGFFPVDEVSLGRFADLMLDSIDQLDVLASWRVEEVYFHRRLKPVYKMPLSEMGPIFTFTPPYCGVMP